MPREQPVVTNQMGSVRTLPNPRPFTLPEEVEKEVISYLEHKGVVKDDFEKALDFILDLNSNFKIDNTHS